MRLRADELQKFNRPVAPSPPPIEPLLAAPEEAALIAKGSRSDTTVAARRARVRALLRRPATPEGADAELFALVAAARALPLERPEDRLSARLRLVGIGSAKTPPLEVRRLSDRLHLAPGDGAAFADALMPRDGDLSAFSEGGGSGASGADPT